MTQTNLAYVSVERIRVTRTQEGINTGLPKEMGTHEWHMYITVNGQVQWWTRHGIETGGEYRVAKTFPLVPLDDGKLKIHIGGWEQDTFGDTELSSRTLTITPAEDCPYGVQGAWVTSYSSSYYGQFIAQEGMQSEGGYDFRVSIHPVGGREDEATQQYAMLFREDTVYNEYYVAGWDDFTKQIDARRGAGRRLGRIAVCEANPERPSFSDQVERTYLGVFEPGDTGMPFWELDKDNFVNKVDEHWKVDQIRPTDIYAYWREDGWAMIGATFDRGENRTEVVAEPRDVFLRQFDARSRSGQGLIAIDSYFDGKDRWFVGLFEHGIGASILWADAEERFIRAKDALHRSDGWRMVDLCSYNDGGTPRFNVIWRPGTKQTWFGTAYGWDHLTNYVSFYWEKKRQLVCLDSWSSAATD